MNPLNHFIISDNSYNRLNSIEISRLAQTIIQKLRPYATNITIAGSIRRGMTPSDIDIVLIPRDKEKIYQTIISMGGRIWSKGQSQIYFKIRGIDVNIYYATPDTYGAQLLTRTGSAGHNIGLRKISQSKGLLLNQYGIYKGKKLLGGKTEREIYNILGRKYKPPEQRQ